jgi:hypothetical protein
MQIQRQTGLSYKSALFMMHRIRYAMTPNGPEPKLDGIVEADETYVGGKLSNRSRAQRRKLYDVQANQLELFQIRMCNRADLLSPEVSDKGNQKSSRRTIRPQPGHFLPSTITAGTSFCFS